MYVPSDPHEAYKMGVEDATKPITTERFKGFTLMGTTCEGVVTEILKDRRKELLTKKVIKWVILLRPGSVREEAYIAQGRLFDSKEVAGLRAAIDFGSNAIGVYPIEIELPL